MTEETGRTPSGLVETFDRHALKLLGGAVVFLFALGTVVYRSMEGWSWVDSFYFSTVAVTTVGFGDLVPSSDASKLFTVFYVLSGIGLITTYVNLQLRFRADRFQKRRGTRE